MNNVNGEGQTAQPYQEWMRQERDSRIHHGIGAPYRIAMTGHEEFQEERQKEERSNQHVRDLNHIAGTQHHRCDNGQNGTEGTKCIGTNQGCLFPPVVGSFSSSNMTKRQATAPNKTSAAIKAGLNRIMLNRAKLGCTLGDVQPSDMLKVPKS